MRGLFLSVALLSVGAVGSAAAAPYIGPEYLKRRDSPFESLAFSWFYFENFEDGEFKKPGVIARNNRPGGSALGVVGPERSYTDSVDADDGLIDGSGLRGHSFGPLGNDGGSAYGFTFAFSRATLGEFPTHVGIAWTDGTPGTNFLLKAFDLEGNSLVS